MNTELDPQLVVDLLLQLADGPARAARDPYRSANLNSSQTDQGALHAGDRFVLGDSIATMRVRMSRDDTIPRRKALPRDAAHRHRHGPAVCRPACRSADLRACCLSGDNDPLFFIEVTAIPVKDRRFRVVGGQPRLDVLSSRKCRIPATSSGIAKASRAAIITDREIRGSREAGVFVIGLPSLA